jgi:hypothetical protein
VTALPAADDDPDGDPDDEPGVPDLALEPQAVSSETDTMHEVSRRRERESTKSPTG